MISRRGKMVAWLMSGATLFSSIMVATAFAVPTMGQKKPPKKTKPKKKDNKAAIAAGKKVFETNCASCHKVGDKGGESAPDLTKIAADKKHDAKWLREKTINPKASNPDSTMPAFEDTIKGKDLDNLVEYLKTLK